MKLALGKTTLFVAIALFTCSLGLTAAAKELKRETATLTSPPQVPPPIQRTEPAHVLVELEVIEKVMPIADGTQYTFWTFGGTVPGSFIRVREGDTVEFHLKNHGDNKMPHNIDLHAVTGTGGGAEASLTAPGHKSKFTFKVLNPGLYVYHCATAPVGMHVANGMYGLIFVEPKKGLPKVDREYYVMQGDYYTVGKYREKGLQNFDMQKAIDENPTYVLFNGVEGALTAEKALRAKTGETIRLFVGNGGPNLVSSFHVIGEIFDRVYFEGGSRFQENVQTSLVPAGGSAIVDFKVEVPGTLIIVDHSLFRAFNKGAVGMIKVEGEERKDIYSGKISDETYVSAPVAPAAPQPAPKVAKAMTKAERMAAGKPLYQTNCAACHQENGLGLPGALPPLAASDYLLKDPKRAVGVVLNGLQGPVTVNGKQYNSVMPPFGHLTDEDVANIVTYVFNSWGNKGPVIDAEAVKEIRKTRKTVGSAL